MRKQSTCFLNQFINVLLGVRFPWFDCKNNNYNNEIKIVKRGGGGGGARYAVTPLRVIPITNTVQKDCCAAKSIFGLRV